MQNLPIALFEYATNFQNNVVAPFWGDHFLVVPSDTVGENQPGQPPSFTGQHMPGQIGYLTENVDSTHHVFTVEWKNIYCNLQNYATPPAKNGIALPPEKNNIASWQVKLYESKDLYSKQGDIEFCYGTSGGNPHTTDQRFMMQNASIGIKGESNVRTTLGIPYADFMNGLFNVKTWDSLTFLSYRDDTARTTTKETINWQPSGGSDYRIWFKALGRLQKEEFWGDGDADLSQIEGQNNAGMDQPRFVTVNDARVIMRSIVLNKQLDSVRRRNAYHGDVNHNGRYYWRDMGAGVIQKTILPWRNYYFGDSLQYILDPVSNTIVPSGINSLKQVFYQVSEYDAALIMHYIGGRLPYLPWLLDTIPQYGKIGANTEPANDIISGLIQKVGDNKYKIPIYLNGTVNGPLSVKFSVNGNVENGSTVKTDKNNLMIDYNNDMFVVAGNGIFDKETPICYLTVQSTDKEITLSDIRFNDKEIGKQVLNLTGVEEVTTNDNVQLLTTPNPFSSKTIISFNVINESNYSLMIYDALGNKVKTLVNESLNPGQHNFEWNGTDDNGSYINSGIYFCKFSGNNVSVVNKIVLTR
jgi:hypothetical protein